MTTPTSDQLAANVPPLVREYIDARIAEAVARAQADFNLGLKALNNSAAHVNQRLAEIATLEKTVRGYMGL